MKAGVRAVVLDFGGVMTTSTMPERVRRCTDELGIAWEHLARGFARYRRLMDGGFIDLRQMYSLIWADADVTLPPETEERILREDTASFLSDYRNGRTLAWMRSLKAEGYRIGILTNMPPAFAERFRACYPEYIALADAMVISGEERMFKPQRRIYELLQGRLGVAASEILFVDDSEENCEGARRAGWQAVRFVTNEQVEGEVKGEG